MVDATAGRDATARLLGLVAGVGIFQALHVAAKFGIADLLADGARPAEDIASRLKADPQTLSRMMRALASVEVFAEERPGVFVNTPASAMLIGDAPGSLRGFVMMTGSPEFWRPWGELEFSIANGKPAFDHVYGQPLFEYLAKNPEPARIFDDAMAGRSAAEISALLAAYDFSDAGRLVDVGGGNGALMSAILGQYPQLTGTVFDLPHVVDAAALTDASRRQSRLKFAGGSFFTDVPPAGDTYLLKKVIHDWPDERAREILARCREAMTPGARLLLIESVVPAGIPPTFMAFLDLWMLVWAGGKERTEEEYRALLTSVGLTLRRVVPTGSPVSVIEAVPV